MKSRAERTAEALERASVELDDGGAVQRDRMNRAGTQPQAAVATSWQDIKSRFVDDPSGAIAAAEDLVQRAVDDRVRALEDRVRALKDEAAQLCARDGDDDPSSTEALRTRLIRYREYCERLAGTSVE
jgi:hypothetical protein